MIRGIKKFNKLSSLKISKTNDIIKSQENKISFILITVLSFLFLVVFHKKTQQINPRPILLAFAVFDTPRILLLNTTNYISDLIHFVRIKNSIMQSNLQLKSQITNLQTANDRFNEISQNINSIVKNDSFKYNITKIISSNDNSGYLLIDKGTQDGIHDKSLVVKNGSLFGSVIKSLENRSYIIPIYDDKFRIPAKVTITTTNEKDGTKTQNTIFGIIRGGSNVLFKFLNQQPSVDITGQNILTSSEGGVAIPNIFAGVVATQTSPNNESYNVDNSAFKFFHSSDILIVISKANLTQEFEDQVKDEFLSIIDYDPKDDEENTKPL